MTRTLEEYLRLNYPVELVAEDEGYFVRHPDLDGCMAQGSTADAALASLEDARGLWISARLEDGLPVPEPTSAEPSGRLLLRMPPWLHGQLVRYAQRQQVSLNQLITSALAEFVGGGPYRADGDRFLAALARMETIADRMSTPSQLFATRILGTAAKGQIWGYPGRLMSGAINIGSIHQPECQGQGEEGEDPGSQTVPFLGYRDAVVAGRRG